MKFLLILTLMVVGLVSSQPVYDPNQQLLSTLSGESPSISILGSVPSAAIPPPSIGDFNGDGKTDYLVSVKWQMCEWFKCKASKKYSINLRFFLQLRISNPSPGAGSAGIPSPGSGSAGIPSFSIEDFNGDGKTDFLVSPQ